MTFTLFIYNSLDSSLKYNNMYYWSTLSEMIFSCLDLRIFLRAKSTLNYFVLLGSCSFTLCLLSSFTIGPCSTWNLTIHEYYEPAEEHAGNTLHTFCSRDGARNYTLPFKVNIVIIRYATQLWNITVLFQGKENNSLRRAWIALDFTNHLSTCKILFFFFKLKFIQNSLLTLVLILFITRVCLVTELLFFFFGFHTVSYIHL